AGVVITEFGTTGQEGLGGSSRKIERRQGVLPVCGRDRAVLDFDLSSLPTDSVVVSARLRAFLVRRALDPEIATVSVSPLGRDVGVGTLREARSGARDASDFTVATSERRAMLEWDITGVAQGWVNDASTNHGVLLYGDCAHGVVAGRGSIFPGPVLSIV